jgi:alpha-glucosidase
LPAQLRKAQDTDETQTVSIKTQMLPNGIEVSGNGVSVRVTASRDDILRVRAGRNGDFGEDASWAVLPGPREENVGVTGEPGGFSTKAHTSTGRASNSILRLNFSDL